MMFLLVLNVKYRLVMNKLENDYYKQYVGCYAKRFYTPFKEENICKIIGFKLENEAFFEVEYLEDEKYWDEKTNKFNTKTNSITWF